MTLEPLPPTFRATVTALHRVAEQVVAPARKPDNEIALMATPDGFGTPAFDWEGLRHQVRVEGAALVWTDGDAARRGGPAGPPAAGSRWTSTPRRPRGSPTGTRSATPSCASSAATRRSPPS